jgi:hypothetical protein
MPFEIIIILFFLYSLYRKHQNDKKKREKLLQQQQYSTDGVSARSGEEMDWEDAMKELESIFSGEPLEKSQPKQQPVEAFSTSASTPQYSSASEAGELERQRRLASIAERNKNISGELLRDESNPIYRRADDVYEKNSSKKETANYLNLLESPQEIRNAIVLKEILDKPKSLRRDKAII